jgi:hypothetical protein
MSVPSGRGFRSFDGSEVGASIALLSLKASFLYAYYTNFRKHSAWAAGL